MVSSVHPVEDIVEKMQQLLPLCNNCWLVWFLCTRRERWCSWLPECTLGSVMLLGWCRERCSIYSVTLYQWWERVTSMSSRSCLCSILKVSSTVGEYLVRFTWPIFYIRLIGAGSNSDKQISRYYNLFILETGLLVIMKMLFPLLFTNNVTIIAH